MGNTRIITKNSTDRNYKIFDFSIMEEVKNELGNREFDPEVLGAKFNNEDTSEFIDFLRRKLKSDPTKHFDIVADWVSVDKVRTAKALLDIYASRLNINSFIIRATQKQYEEDVNAFESGLKWEEI